MALTKESLKELEVQPTAAHISLAKFLTENTGVEVTPEQSWAFILGHRVWQSSDERREEKEAEKVANAEAAEKAKAERAEKAAIKKAEKEAADAAKAEKKAAAEAAKAAKAEAGESDDSDLDDETDSDEAASTPKRRRPAAKKETAAVGSF